MARNAEHFPHLLTIDLRDQTGWLGREDSNLRMAESKSDQFPNKFAVWPFDIYLSEISNPRLRPKIG
jgi:hypothetical protein